jgi:hypothetical protein
VQGARHASILDRWLTTGRQLLKTGRRYRDSLETCPRRPEEETDIGEAYATAISILVVEDDPMVATYILDVLVELGFVVVRVLRGEDRASKGGAALGFPG